MERLFLRLSFVTIPLTGVLLISLVPYYGLVGAALALAVGNVTVDIVELILLKRYLNIRWWDRRFLGWILPAAVALSVGWSLGAFDIAFRPVELAGALAGMYVIFWRVSLAQGLHEDDTALLRQLRNLLWARNRGG